jgi:hypothetical protein
VLNENIVQSKNGIVILLFWGAVAAGMPGCVTKVYPDSRLAIGPYFLRLFNSLSREDTLSFRNSMGREKTFVVGRVDS